MFHALGPMETQQLRVCLMGSEAGNSGRCSCSRDALTYRLVTCVHMLGTTGEVTDSSPNKSQSPALVCSLAF